MRARQAYYRPASLIGCANPYDQKRLNLSLQLSGGVPYVHQDGGEAVQRLKGIRVHHHLINRHFTEVCLYGFGEKISGGDVTLFGGLYGFGPNAVVDTERSCRAPHAKTVLTERAVAQ